MSPLTTSEAKQRQSLKERRDPREWLFAAAGGFVGILLAQILLRPVDPLDAAFMSPVPAIILAGIGKWVGRRILRSRR